MTTVSKFPRVAKFIVIATGVQLGLGGFSAYLLWAGHRSVSFTWLGILLPIALLLCQGSAYYSARQQRHSSESGHGALFLIACEIVCVTPVALLAWLLRYMDVKGVWWPGLKQLMVDPKTLPPNELFGESFGLVGWVFFESLAGVVGLTVLCSLCRIARARGEDKASTL